MSVLNFKYNCIFIAVPRTASSSMAQLLGKSGHEDIMYYKTFLNYLSEGIEFEDLFKFAFVRNPYTRFISCFNNLDSKENINKFTLNLKNWWYTKDKYKQLLFKPQWRYLRSWGYDNQMDYIGRFENLKDDWKTVCRRLNIEYKLPHLAKSNKKHKLNKESKEIVKRIYLKDFEIYNYEMY